MHVGDLIRFARADGLSQPDLDEIAKRWQKIVSAAATQKALRAADDGDRRFRDTIETLALEHDTALAALIFQFGPIPRKLRTDAGTWQHFVVAPKASLSKLRTIADQLGAIMIPFEFVDPDCQPKAAERATIKSFSGALRGHHRMAVLVTPDYYSMQAHASAKISDEPFYRDLYAPEGAIKGMLMTAADTAVMERDSVQRTRRGSLGTGKAEDQLHALNQRFRQRWPSVSPAYSRGVKTTGMLFAIACGHTLLENGFVTLGPSWGPGFADDIGVALNLEKIGFQQGEQLDKTMSAWATMTAAASPDIFCLCGAYVGQSRYSDDDDLCDRCTPSSSYGRHVPTGLG